MSRPSTPIDTGVRFILCRLLNDKNYVWAVTIHTERKILEYFAKKYPEKYGYMIIELSTVNAENIMFNNRLCNINGFEQYYGKWTPV